MQVSSGRTPGGIMALALAWISLVVMNTMKSEDLAYLAERMILEMLD